MLLLTRLIRANQGLLQHKLALMEALQVKHGPPHAQDVFCQQCPIAKASIGQHVRHSMDHIQRVVAAMEQQTNNANTTLQPQHQQDGTPNNTSTIRIHYDTRERGLLEERDMGVAHDRIQDVLQALTRLDENHQHISVLDPRRVHACFFLNDSDKEITLPTTLARELGFAAHHAIHHLAMIQIIATTSGGLARHELPDGFGKAPSTLLYEQTQQQQQDQQEETTRSASSSSSSS